MFTFVITNTMVPIAGLHNADIHEYAAIEFHHSPVDTCFR